jgi:hypothetical protein
MQHLIKARQASRSGRFAAQSGDAEAEALLRASLKSYWSAMNWLEGDPEFDLAHDELHDVGRAVRLRFVDGCRPEPQPDGGHIQRCPVALAHKRFGFSIGGTGNAVCSICGDDASECAHTPGRSYLVEAGRHKGWCNICGEEACKSHDIGTKYDAEARVIITEMQLREISIVSRPAHPDARLTKIDMSRGDVERELGRLPSGAHLSCDKCLSSCQGFDYLPER